MGCSFVKFDEIDRDDGFEQAGRITLSDTYRQQCSNFPGEILDECGGPLGFGIGGVVVEISGREYGDGAGGDGGGLVHKGDEVCASTKVPGLYDGGVASSFQLPRNPLGPGSVGFIVADKKVAGLRHEAPEVFVGCSTVYSTDACLSIAYLEGDGKIRRDVNCTLQKSDAHPFFLPDVASAICLLYTDKYTNINKYMEKDDKRA